MPALIGGAAFDAARSIFGKKPPDRNASLRLRKIFKKAQAGDQDAIAELARRAQEQGSRFKNINAKARKYYAMVTRQYAPPGPQRGNTTQSGGNPPWVGSTGPAPAAGYPTPPAMPQPWGYPAPPATNPRPCKYGPRDPYTGRCPPRPSAGASQPSGFYGPYQDYGAPTAPAPRGSSRPCKYGPRGPDGYCPPRPSGNAAGPSGGRPCKYGPRDADGRCPPRPSRYSRSNGVSIPRGVQTRLENAGANLAAQYGPQAAAFVAKTGLVVAAGLAAYWATTQLMRIRYRTVDELTSAISMDYVRARREAEAKLGRPMTQPEAKQLYEWYGRKIGKIQAYYAQTGSVPREFVNLTMQEP